MEARKFLTNYSNDAAEKTTAEWKKLGEYLLVKYMDGNIKKEENGKFIQNDHAIPPSIIRAGYTPDFQQKIAKENPGLRVKSAAELNNRK